MAPPEPRLRPARHATLVSEAAAGIARAEEADAGGAEDEDEG